MCWPAGAKKAGVAQEKAIALVLTNTVPNLSLSLPLSLLPFTAALTSCTGPFRNLTCGGKEGGTRTRFTKAETEALFSWPVKEVVTLHVIHTTM
jgi:hypothetical protein